MRLPRDLSGAQLVKGMQRLGYSVSRQTGSHMRLTCMTPTQHHVTVPSHDPLRIGTLAAILDSVTQHHNIDRQQLLKQLLD